MAVTTYDERSQEMREVLGPRGERFPGDGLRADGGRGPRFPGDDNLDDQRNDDTLRRGGPTGQRGGGRSSGEGGDESKLVKANRILVNARAQLAKQDLTPVTRRRAEERLAKAERIVGHEAAMRSPGYRRMHAKEMRSNAAYRNRFVDRQS